MGKELSNATSRMALTPARKKRYDGYMTVYQNGVVGLWDAAKALMAIEEQRLYEDRFDSFEDFLEVECGLSRQRGRQLIDACETRERLAKIFAKPPDRESHLAVWATVPPDKCSNVMDALEQESAKIGKPITAVLIKKVAKQFLPPPPPKPKPDDTVEADSVSPSEEAETDEVVSPQLHQSLVPESKSKVSPAGAAKVEQYIQNNGQPVPLELYPVWRLKPKYFELTNRFRELSGELRALADGPAGNDVTASLADTAEKLWQDLSNAAPSTVGQDGVWRGSNV